jgi:4-hydroxy-tetrahydrodipicolinate synthase
VNDAVDIPQILYNVPSRTGCDLSDETIIKLSGLENIVGVKDATGDLNRIEAIKNGVDKEFALISGDDLSFVDYLKKGGNAVISVTANLVPKQMHHICEQIQKNNYCEADALNQKLQALHEMMFIEPNPIPVKWALSYLGMINGKLRLPMVELDKIYQASLTKLLNTIK